MIEAKIERVVASYLLTQEDKIIFAENIKTLENEVFRKSSASVETETASLDPAFYEFLEKLKEDGLFPLTAGEQLSLLKEIEAYLNSLTLVRLTLAFKPRRDFLVKLVSFFNQNGARKVVLDIYSRAEIVAGVVLEYQGNYRDYSIAHDLDNLSTEEGFMAGLLNQAK